jgi:hypothetical protein
MNACFGRLYRLVHISDTKEFMHLLVSCDNYPKGRYRIYFRSPNANPKWVVGLISYQPCCLICWVYYYLLFIMFYNGRFLESPLLQLFIPINQQHGKYGQRLVDSQDPVTPKQRVYTMPPPEAKSTSHQAPIASNSQLTLSNLVRSQRSMLKLCSQSYPSLMPFASFKTRD